MPGVAAAFTAVKTAFAATALGSFLTTTTLGKLISGTVLSLARAALFKPKEPPPSGLRTQQTQTGGTTPASLIVDLFATEGQLIAPPMTHGSLGDIPNVILTYVIDLGDVPGLELSRLILDGEYVTIDNTPDSAGNFRILGRFTGAASMKFYDGTQTAADPFLLSAYGTAAERPWEPSMIGRDKPYLITHFVFNRNVFSSFPSVRAEVRNGLFYDLRLDSTAGGSGPQRFNDRSTWGPTTNLVVIIYNIMRGIDLGGGNVWGGEIEAEDLPIGNWVSAMNVADFRGLRIGYEIYVDDEPARVIEELLKGGLGEIAEMGGVFKIRLNGPGIPVYFFTDDDIDLLQAEQEDQFPDPSQIFNGITANYPSPESLWQAKEAPPRYNAAWEAEDGGERNVADVTFAAVWDGDQVQQLMAAYIKKQRRFISYQLNLPSDAIALEPLDTVAWTSETHSYDAKLFDIERMVDPLLTSSVQVGLLETDPDDFSEVALVSQFLPSFQREALGSQIATILSAAAQTAADSAVSPARPTLELQWPTPLPDVTGVAYEVRLESTQRAVVSGTFGNPDQGSGTVSGLVPGLRHEVRIRYVARNRPTEWSAWSVVTAENVQIRNTELGPQIVERDNITPALTHNVETIIRPAALTFNDGNIVFQRDLQTTDEVIRWTFGLNLDFRDLGTYNWSSGGSTGQSRIRTRVVLQAAKQGLFLGQLFDKTIRLKQSELSSTGWEDLDLSTIFVARNGGWKVRAIIETDYGSPGEPFQTALAFQENTRNLNFTGHGFVND
ncbi:MAG: phage tail protein [Paracoccaceae bacterium]